MRKPSNPALRERVESNRPLRIAERALRRNDKYGSLTPTLRQRLLRWWHCYWEDDNE